VTAITTLRKRGGAFSKEARPKPSSLEEFGNRMSEAFGDVCRVVVWIAIAVPVLVVGAAVLKWAVEELAK
jgi:hypothetical protein